VIDILELERRQAAALIVKHLACQAGIDVVPAGVGRFLTYVYHYTGFKFEQIGHGRHHDVFDIVSPHGGRLGIVLKLGNRPSIQAELKFVAEFPQDWAKVYDSFDFGLVCEKIALVGSDDGLTKDPEFRQRLAELADRYSSVTLDDIGLIGDRVVITGSSQRVKRT